MKVSYYLTRPLAKDEKSPTRETSIYARICYAGNKFKYYIPESINPKFWNLETQRAKETQKFKEFPEFNARLDHIKSSIKNIYRKYLNDNGNLTPSPATLRTILDKEIKKREAEKEPAKTFFGLFEAIIKQTSEGVRINAKTGKPISKGTCKTYTTALNHLKSFQGTRKRPIDFDTIDLDFYSDYTEYLIKKAKLSTNTIGKHIRTIKLIMNEATEKGINKSLVYKSRRFASIAEKADTIYLSEDELRQLEALDLSEDGRLEKVRDLFLIGCYTGLRYSDFSILKPENIHEGFIKINQAKTGDSVVIPVHPTVQKIINKYGGQLPRSISNQKTNNYLKALGQLIPAGSTEPVLNTLVTKTITKGGVKVSKSYKKWELLTTHTARRSFATNEYLAGTPTVTIMAITGHKSEKTFLGYIKLTPNEHAKLLELHWKKRHAMSAV